MPDIRIDELPPAGPLTGGEIVPIMQNGITAKTLINALGGGTVTSVSGVDANGLAWSIASPSTLPAMTLSISVSGLLKGSGGALVAATNTDLPAMTATEGGAVPTPPNNTTTFLRGDGSWAAVPETPGAVTGVLKGVAGAFVTATNADLPIMTATVGGAVPTPPNTVTTFLRGDGTWADLLAAVRSVVLTGLSFVSSADIAATDTILQALGKVQAKFTALTSSAGSSSVGFIHFVAGSVTRTLQDKTRDVFSVKDEGAIGNASTDDAGALNASTVSGSAVTLPFATGYLVNSGWSIAGDSIVSGSGRASPIKSGMASSTGNVISLSGSNIDLSYIYVNGANSDGVIQASAGVSNVKISGLDITTDVTAAYGMGIQTNATGITNWIITGTSLNVQGVGGWGVLINPNNGATQSGFLISTNIVTSKNNDAICINTQGAAGIPVEDVVISGNIASAQTSGSSPNSGFGIAVANADGVTIVGNVSPASRNDGIHIEDDCKNVTTVGNVLKNCVCNGVHILINGLSGVTANAKGIPVIGNTIESATKNAGYSGIAVTYGGSGNVSQCPIIGNFIRNFDSGILVGSGGVTTGTYKVDGNTIQDCNNAMAISTGGTLMQQVQGVNFVKNCHTLLYVAQTTGHMIRVGKFICEDKPTNIVVKNAPGVTRPGVIVEGFSWPFNATVINSVSSQYFNVFPAGGTNNQFKGTVSFVGRSTAAASTNFYYSADVVWNGAALTITNAISEVNGTLMMGAPALQVAGGQLQLGLFQNTVPNTVFIEVNFDGQYIV